MFSDSLEHSPSAAGACFVPCDSSDGGHSPQHSPVGTRPSPAPRAPLRLPRGQGWVLPGAGITFLIQPRRGDNDLFSPLPGPAAASHVSGPAAAGRGGARPPRAPSSPAAASRPAPPPPALGAGQHHPLGERRARAPAPSALPFYWLA